jgi:hypothetical protein
VVQFLREEGPASPSMGFHARVMAAVEAEEAPAVSWWAWLRRPFGFPIEGLAVAAAAAAVLLLALPRGGPAPDRSEWGELPEGAEQSPAAMKQPAALPEEGLDAEPGPPVVEPVVEAPAPSPTPVVDESPKPVASKKGVEAPKEPAQAASKATEPAPSAGEGEADPRMVAAPNRYDLRTDDPEVKRALLAAIDRVGGTLVAGEQTGVMSGSREQLRVRLSQEALASFDAQLRQLGVSVDRAFDDTRLYGAGSEIEIDLQLTLEGGPTTPSQAAPPRSRRSTADDLMFEAESIEE